jgi:agmatine/peptidylarginine deiminase
MEDYAYKAIAVAYPDRQAFLIDAADLVSGGGGIHCNTKPQPAPAV